MSPDAVVVVGAGAILAVASVSGRLDRVWLTEPLLAAVIGVGVGLALVEDLSLESPLILTALELTLALVLFSDASRIEVRRLREGYSWPLRMLVIGMPVVIVLGTVVAAQYLALPLGFALLLGVILAPTDAALAEPVLVSPLVPERVRQTLNVESGLNDGLAVPVLLIAIGIIEAEEGAGTASAVGLVLTQLGIGVIGGLVLGWLGALLIGKGADSGWMNPLHQKIAAVALALAGYAAVQILGGSGFVAIFIAGGLMRHLLQPRPEYLYELAEEEGHALVLLAFFIFGVGPGAQILSDGVSVQAIVMSVISLVLLRPISVAVSLWGQKLQARTVAFLGWFGPRGLATVVFALVALEELGSMDPLVEETIMVTVLISIVVHGLSAVPLSHWLSRMPTTTDMPEHGEAYPHPTRR